MPALLGTNTLLQFLGGEEGGQPSHLAALRDSLVQATWTYMSAKDHMEQKATWREKSQGT